ncbi:hypothetical protein TSUD_81730 [Trifolium subterraneum]|uniref:Uncharacterized protein n=1 Tax=Trifolium subterraneum TaxID=3900 RepID=A0A2Z6LVJ4_TRISU|nr:hypothetical protein TSUD_81730 [Trifolium subterraneum]
MTRGIKNRQKAKNKNKTKKRGESSSSVPEVPVKVWQPGVDNFDILRDTLGLVRTEFPHTVYFVTGTQAEKPSWNSIGIFKVSNISGKRRELLPKTSDSMDDEDSDSDDDSEDEEEGGAGAPTLQARSSAFEFLLFNLTVLKEVILLTFSFCSQLQLRKVTHEGCVNRIRSMTQNPHICASWAESGYVQIWDMSSHLTALAETEVEGVQGVDAVQVPLQKFKHRDEGYAIDWSPLVPGRLLSGDCNNNIYLWEPTSAATWNVNQTPFTGHTASVEDLQWSPGEPHVFASCSVDKSIAIWDTRLGRSPAASFQAHKADVNVLSWNRLASVMLASGGDDGTISIRDLRMLKDGDAVVAHFEYHKHPITSIEWSPHEASSLAVSSADNQLTIWDLSLEKDEEEEAEFKARTKEQVNAPQDLPPQLLFIHQGQKDPKELHWHTQIPGMIVCTAADGFNVLMPSNIQSTLPSEPEISSLAS